MFDPENDNQLWRQESDGRIKNKANGKIFYWNQNGPGFEVYFSKSSIYSVSNVLNIKNSDSDFKWSFNKCTRSSQEPSGPISQKFQAGSGSGKVCLNTVNRLDSNGSTLMLYSCDYIHPVNGCFKFKEI